MCSQFWRRTHGPATKSDQWLGSRNCFKTASNPKLICSNFCYKNLSTFEIKTATQLWFQIIIFGWSKNAFFKVYGTYLFIQAFNETIGARNNQKSENVKK